MKKGQKCFIADTTTDFVVKTGEFVSRGTQWSYILFENGNVRGYADHVIFKTEAEALLLCLNSLKEKVVKDFKLPEETKEKSK